MKSIQAALESFRNGDCVRSELWDAVVRDITENLRATRASLWSFNVARDEIYCESLYDARFDKFSHGIVLRKADFGDYFDAILADVTVDAPDARTHPATRCFNEGYFEPNDIRSLLDYVVLDGATPVGVLCCEHCGSIKTWTNTDQYYLRAIAGIMGYTLQLRV